MRPMLETILKHLRALVAYDTQNQSGNASVDQLYGYICDHLTTFEISEQGGQDSGDQTLFATRGTPRILINIHTDTVPAGKHWSRDPFKLQVNNERAIGLGACDIKGALACWLTAVEQYPDADAALLLCSDEEAGGSRGVRRFLKEWPEYDLALIAEPTNCKAISAHRGYASATVRFDSQPGHSSEPRALHDNSIHQAGRFLAQALELAEGYADNLHPDFPHLHGICLNAGRIHGGSKNNVIAGHAELSFGCRPLPGQSGTALMDEMRALPAAQIIKEWQTLSADPALPAGDGAPDGTKYIEELGLQPGGAVSFWTEASLFSAAGIPALVCGPGDIAQAHTADEWISLQMLMQMAEIYTKILSTS